MSDVVITLPVTMGEESQLFGNYVSSFMESRTAEVDRYADDSDAPYLMIRSDPAIDMEVKTVIFQERSVAQAFSSGWALTRGKLRPLSPL